MAIGIDLPGWSIICNAAEDSEIWTPGSPSRTTPLALESFHCNSYGFWHHILFFLFMLKSNSAVNVCVYLCFIIDDLIDIFGFSVQCSYVSVRDFWFWHGNINLFLFYKQKIQWIYDPEAIVYMINYG